MSKFTKANDDLDDESWRDAHRNDVPEKRQGPVDNRSLFERLQEQKAAKEDAYNEAAKFSNLIRRLDNAEIDFLVSVNEQKELAESKKRREQEAALTKFKSAQREIDSLQTEMISLQRSGNLMNPASTRLDPAFSPAEIDKGGKRKRLGVSGVIKKKSKGAPQASVDSENSEPPASVHTTVSSSHDTPAGPVNLTITDTIKPSGVRSLIDYYSSSDSENG